MDRRYFLLSSASATIAAASGGTTSAARAEVATARTAQDAAPAGFGFDDVARVAERLASSGYAPPSRDLVGSFRDLSYDQYRGIRFSRDHDPWAELEGFGLDLLPPGMLFKDAVTINLVDDGMVQALPFDPQVFDYDPQAFPDGVDGQTVGEMGWSGFRLRTVLNRPDVLDEFAVFQGASYFRAVSRGTRYGQSARGLAIGTGSAAGEEFPLFREFWIHRPNIRDGSVTVHALLDSTSVTGAYEFVISPGEETVFQTRASVFPRRDLADVGIAPLTSMYWFGPAGRTRIDDFRPAVHDTEGLQIATGQGRDLWRVLSGHRDLQLSAFLDEDPLGFGLMQRTRDFDAYQDAEARYDLRPSCWVAPRERWGKGNVVLVEIPVDNEFNDNIVTFWRPGEPLRQGTRYDFAYDLSFTMEHSSQSPVGRVVSTMSGRSVNDKAARTFVIDFEMDALGEEIPLPHVTASAGTIGHPYAVMIPSENVVRLAFEFRAEGAALAELSAVFNGPEGPLSETWLHRWTKE